MIIKYVNSENKEIVLNKKPYKVLLSDLTDYEWEFVENNSRIICFTKDIVEKELNIDIISNSKAITQEYGNRLNECFEQDICSNIPGKIYIDDFYMMCFVKSCQKIKRGSGVIQSYEYKIVTDYPFWIKEHPYYFKTSDVTSVNNKRYANKYAYRYANGLNNTYLINEHYAECNFRLNIYGPCVKPSVYIGGYEYHVDTVLEAGEYLEIDSAAETVTKILNSGIKVNAFHYRSFENSVFRPIQVGRREVFWDGKFDFDLILFEERSEPKWS